MRHLLLPSLLCAALASSSAPPSDPQSVSSASSDGTRPALARELVRTLRVSVRPRAVVRNFLARNDAELPQAPAAHAAWFRSAIRALPAGRRVAAQASYAAAIRTGGAAGARRLAQRGNADNDTPVSGSGIFLSNPHGPTVPPAGTRLSGTVGWRSTPRLMDLYADAGVAGGLYRRTVFLHRAEDFRYIGEDFVEAERIGLRTWLTCVGTPQELSPHPERTDNEFSQGLPEYARHLPLDADAWSDTVLRFLAAMESRYGVTPEYLEIWNEPERVEWFAGSSADLLDFYAQAATRLRQARPALRIGGPGLAGYRSSLDGQESLLHALVRHAAATGAPLDFISWHNYGPANELSFTHANQQVETLASSLGLTDTEAIVSEWNIYPSAQGAVGPEFDGAHSAANYAGFVTTAAQLGLDGNMFFLDLDEGNDRGLTDLAGVSLGAITKHGIKKPVMHVLEAMTAMSRQPGIPVRAPDEEYNLRVAASRSGDVARYVISNDCVSGGWVFANRARQHGMDPGWLNPRWLDAGGSQATRQRLVAAGLSGTQASAVLGFMPEVLAADRLMREPRAVTLTMLGRKPFSVKGVIRFTATTNAPALHRDAILSQLEAAAEAARNAAATAGAQFLVQRGYEVTAPELLAIGNDFFGWAASLGILDGHAAHCWKIVQDTRRDEQLAASAWLNSLPGIQLVHESAAEAGIRVEGRNLRFDLDPEAVLILDLQL